MQGHWTNRDIPLPVSADTSEPILEVSNDADGLLQNGELGKRRRRRTGVNCHHLT